ncbi:MAG: hypothetical protein KIG15_02260, partial [Coriobacteriales bacterium]|nr:hypothetical protein [Coriobacteriales bacterium]
SDMQNDAMCRVQPLVFSKGAPAKAGLPERLVPWSNNLILYAARMCFRVYTVHHSEQQLTTH